MTQLIGMEVTLETTAVERIEWNLPTSTMIAVTHSGAHLPMAEVPDELVPQTIQRVAERLADPEWPIVNVEQIVAELHQATDYQFFQPEEVASS